LIELIILIFKSKTFFTQDQKLKTLDRHYLELSDNFSGKLTFEEKIIGYQSKLEEKSKAELAKKVTKGNLCVIMVIGLNLFLFKLSEFKEIELSRMRIEEREKLRLELQSYRLEMEQKYQKRHDALKQKENSFDSILNHKRELEEREIFIQRQHLLDEMKQLREKENDMKKNFEFQLKLIGNDSSKYEAIDEKLKKREADLKAAEVDFENRLRNERERIKQDLERAFAQREFILENVETKNKQDSIHNSIERAQLDRIKHEYQIQQTRLNEISLEMERAKGEAICLKQENELMKEKLSHLLDYDFIVQENKMLRYKLEISKELIGEKSLTKRTPRHPEFVDGVANGSGGDYVPRRKRSVTFASEDGEQGIPLLDLNNDMATERSAEPLPNDETSRKLTYREEGEKILSEAVDKIEQPIIHGVLNNELRDLYEMQIYEQRKLQETINDVKKNVEFLYNGVNEATEGDTKKHHENSLGTFDFISSAKDRYKYLESEGERIEQTYRDYQYKIKSKYYPINDSEDDQIKIITTNKKKSYDLGELEKFLELTAKTSVNTKVMREEIETEMHNYSAQKESERNAANTLRTLENVESLIKNVSLPSFHSKIEKKNASPTKKNYLEDDTSISSTNVKETEKEKPSIFTKKMTPEENSMDTFSKVEDNYSQINSKKKFEISDYKGLFEKASEKIDEPKSSQIKETTPPRKIKIVYSSSSPSSTASSSSDEKSVSIGKGKSLRQIDNKKSFEEDDDEDFKW